MFSFSPLRNIKNQAHSTFEMYNDVELIILIVHIGFRGLHHNKKKTISVSIYGKEI